MNNMKLQRYAPIGLYLAGLAALVTGGLAIVQRSFDLPVQISLGLVIIGLALYVLLDPASARSALTGRQARYGSNALLLTVAFIGIIVVINYLVSSHSKQWDLTEDQTNTLTSESIKVLDSLKTKVTANAYFSTQMGASAQDAQKLLQNFKSKSNGKFDYQIIDPTTDPIRAQQDNVQRDGTIVLKMGNRQEQVSYATEQDIATGLIKLANPGKRAVYFLTGHGEFGLDATGDNNYSQVKSALEAKNYTVNTLNLLSTAKIPEDALAIIVGGPTKPLSQQEVDLIKAYQEKGGALIYMAEPTPLTKFGTQPDPMAAYLQQTWGITMGDNMVLDPNTNQGTIAVGQPSSSSPITQKMSNMYVVLPTARSVEAGKAPDGVTLTPLATTSSAAWGETDFASIQNRQPVPDKGKDLIGPVTLAVSGENSNNKARVLVIGDAEFATNQAYTQYGNSDLILNSIDWSAAQDNLISLTPHQPVQRVIVPPQRYTMGLILLGTIFFLPGLVVLTGVTVFLQRRRRG